MLLFLGLAGGLYWVLTKIDELLFDAIVLHRSLSLTLQTSLSLLLRLVIILLVSGLSFAIFKWHNGAVIAQASRKSKKVWRWVLLSLGLLIIILSGVVLANQAVADKRQAVKSSSTAVSKKKAAAGQITPYDSFSDAMDTTLKSSVVSNRFIPSSGKIPLTDPPESDLIEVRPLVLSSEKLKWMDSQITLDQAWVAKFQPTMIDMGKDQVSVNGAVVFQITIKTGKYDNYYYPSQGRLVTNLGTSYEPAASFIMDGGMPRHKNRSQYIYFCFEQTLDDVQQVKYFRYSFAAIVGDEQTEKLPDHSVTVEFDNKKQPLEYGAPIQF